MDIVFFILEISKRRGFDLFKVNWSFLCIFVVSSINILEMIFKTICLYVMWLGRMFDFKQGNVWKEVLHIKSDVCEGTFQDEIWSTVC